MQNMNKENNEVITSSNGPWTKLSADTIRFLCNYLFIRELALVRQCVKFFAIHIPKPPIHVFIPSKIFPTLRGCIDHLHMRYTHPWKQRSSGFTPRRCLNDDFENMIIPEIWLNKGSHDLKFKNDRNHEDYTLEIELPITIRGVPTMFEAGTKIHHVQILGRLAINGRIRYGVSNSDTRRAYLASLNVREMGKKKKCFLLEHVAIEGPPPIKTSSPRPRDAELDALTGIGFQSSVGPIKNIVLSGCCFHHFKGWAVRVSKLDSFLMKRWCVCILIL